MFKKLLILIPVFYFLTLLQGSFLPFNLILILVILINLFEKQENYLGISSTLPAGFFLDIYSQKPIGYYILILLITAVFIKIVLKKYIHIPLRK